MQSSKATSNSFRTRTSTQQLVLVRKRPVNRALGLLSVHRGRAFFASALPQRWASSISIGQQALSDRQTFLALVSGSFAWRIRASSLHCFPVNSAHLAEICSQEIRCHGLVGRRCRMEELQVFLERDLENWRDHSRTLLFSKRSTCHPTTLH